MLVAGFICGEQPLTVRTRVVCAGLFLGLNTLTLLAAHRRLDNPLALAMVFWTGAPYAAGVAAAVCVTRSRYLATDTLYNLVHWAHRVGSGHERPQPHVYAPVRPAPDSEALRVRRPPCPVQAACSFVDRVWDRRNHGRNKAALRFCPL